MQTREQKTDLLIEKRADCPCKRTKCPRYGCCAACRGHHAAEKKNLPSCERLKAKSEKRAARARY